MAEAARLYRAHRLADAADWCRAAIRRDPAIAEAWHLLGVTSLERGDADAALASLERAVALAPGSAQAQYHLGNALLALERRSEAAARFRAALAITPESTEAENNLGNALRGMGRDDEAIACYRRVLERRPDDASALYNLGLSLAGVERRGAAEAALRGALACLGGAADPSKQADVHAALATVLIAQARDQDALEQLDAELRLRPTALGMSNKGLVLLRLGRLREGWPLYEQRWHAPDFRQGKEALRPIPAVPDLDRLSGQRVLVRGEQGRGDVIQFARYVPLLARRGARVILSVFPELVAVLRALPGAAQVVGDDAPDPPHDVVASLMSLPLAFGTDLGSIPAEIPYVSVDPALRAAWAERLGETRKRRVALCWSGSDHSHRRASMALETLLPILSVRGLVFHAVTKEMPAADRALLARTRGVRDHAALLTDFAETAALLSHMDLLISVDTSVAHLAAALGLPVWIMLRHSPDWRWMHDRTDSPWYPTARLFRDASGRGWDPVVAQVVEALVG